MGDEGTILVTGICGRLGRALARRLHREHAVAGLDRRPFPGKPKDIRHHQIDIRRKKVEEVFARENIRAVIHMAIMHDPRMDAEEHHSFNVMGTRRIFDLCLKHGVKKIVVLSSANVYGPRADNTQFITEDTPLMASERFGEVRDLVMVDLYANTFLWKHPDVETVVLRPVHIVGNVSNAPSNYLRLPRIPTVMGYDPMIQLIHEDDVVDAMMRSLAPGIRGVFNVVGPDPVPLHAILKHLGRPVIPVPSPLFTAGLSLGFRLGLTAYLAPELDHLRYVCMVDGSAFERAADFRPQRDLGDILRCFRGHVTPDGTAPA